MPQTLALAASASGATTVIPARAGYAVRVYAGVVSLSGAVNVKFQSHNAPTDLTGLYYGAAAGATVTFAGLGSEQRRGHFQTLAGEALDINLSGATAVGGHLVWEYVGS